MHSINKITDRERALLQALQSIVMETMQYPLQRPYSADSHLPAQMISEAQDALRNYGLHIEDNRPALRVVA